MWPHRGRSLTDQDRPLDQALDMSQHKSTLQQLNSRLSSYIHQVGRLEAANQALEWQIEAELKKKSPTERKHLDAHLRTASRLQEQIGACAWQQAGLKLQCLGAELALFDLKSRCDKERAERERLEARLSDLRLLGAEPKERQLTDLRQEVEDKEEELRLVQRQHQQDVWGFLAQSTGGVMVKVQSRVPDQDLTEQLRKVSWTGVSLPQPDWDWDWSQDRPQSQTHWVQAGGDGSLEELSSELLDLKTTAETLEKELDQLRTQNRTLEAGAVRHMEEFEEQLQLCQLRAARLCEELHSVLEASARQEELNQDLNQTTAGLRSELDLYKDLLQRTNQRVSSPAVAVTSFKATSAPLRRNVPLTLTHTNTQKSFRAVQEGQPVSRRNGFTPNSEGNRATIGGVEVRPGRFASTEISTEAKDTDKLTVQGTNLMWEPLQAEAARPVSVDVDKPSSVLEVKFEAVSSEEELDTKEKHNELQDAKVNAKDAIQEVSVNENVVDERRDEEMQVVRTEGYQEMKLEVSVLNGATDKNNMASEQDVVGEDLGLKCDQSKLRERVGEDENIDGGSEASLNAGILEDGPHDIKTVEAEMVPSARQEESLTIKEVLVTTNGTDSGVNGAESLELEACTAVETQEPLDGQYGEKSLTVDASESQVMSADLAMVCSAIIETNLAQVIFDLESLEVAANAKDMPVSSERRDLDGSEEDMCPRPTQEQEFSPNAPKTADEKGFESSQEQASEDSGAVCAENVFEEPEIIDIYEDGTGKVDVEPLKECIKEVEAVAKPGDNEGSENCREEGAEKMLASAGSFSSKEAEREVYSSLTHERELSTEVQNITAKNGLESPKTISEVKEAVSENAVVQIEDQEVQKEQTSLADSGVLCSSLPEQEMDLEELRPQKIVFRQSPVEEEVFLRITEEEVFCPEDLEDFGETNEMFLSQNDTGADPDFDEDLTEANARVRPVERYILKESPSLSSDDLPDLNTLRDSFGSFRSDERDAPACTSVSESMQISSVQRIFADKEKELGFGGLYRAKATGNSKESYTEKTDVVVSASEGGGNLEDGLEKDEIAGGQANRNLGSSKPVWHEEKIGKTGIDDWICQNGSLGQEGSVIENSAAGKQDGGQKISPKPESVAEVGGCNGGQVNGRSLESDSRMDSAGVGLGKAVSDDWVGSRSVATTEPKVLGSDVHGEDVVQKSEGSQASLDRDFPVSPPASQKVGSEWRAYGRSSGRMSMSPPKQENLDLSRQVIGKLHVAPSPPEKGRLGMLYGGAYSGGNVEVRKGQQDLEPRALSPGRFGKAGSGEWLVYGSSGGRISRSRSESEDVQLKARPREMSPLARSISPTETGRFGRAGSGEWLVYGTSRETISRSRLESDELQFDLSPKALSPVARPMSPVARPMSPVARPMSPVARPMSPVARPMSPVARPMSPVARPMSPVARPMSPTETGRFGKAGNGEWLVYGSSGGRISRSRSESNDVQFDLRPRAMSPLGRPMSPTEVGRSGKFFGSFSPENSQIDLRQYTLSPRPMSPPPVAGRFGKARSGEWLVYGNSSSSGRISKSSSDEMLTSLSPRAISPNGSGHFGMMYGSPKGEEGSLGQRSMSPETGRFSRSGSGEWMVYRSLSPQKTEMDESQFDLRKQTISPPNVGRFGKMGRKDWLVYRNASGKGDENTTGVDLRKRTVSPPGVGQFGKTLASLSRAVSSERVKPGGVVRRSSSVDSGGKLSRKSGRVSSSSSTGKNLISSLGKFVSGSTSGEWRLGRSRSSGSNKGSKEGGGGSSAASGGRVITSSDGPIRSSGSGAGAKKERISVCKMAAMSMSAARTERSQDKRDKKTTAASPSVQLWLTTSETGLRPDQDQVSKP